MWYHSHVESNFKKDTNKLIYKIKADLEISKTNLQVTKGEGWGEGINQDLEMNIHTEL